MDDQTKRKIPIAIREHILQTKIGYVIEAMMTEQRLEKKRCTPIIPDTSDQATDTVYIQHSAKVQGDYNFNKQKMITVNKDGLA